MGESGVLLARKNLLAQVLLWASESLRQFGPDRMFPILDKYPKDYKNFAGYLGSIKPIEYLDWLSFFGCLISPISYTEGNCHLVMITNGLLAKHLANIPPISSERESALVTKHILRLNRREVPIGGIHFHVVAADEIKLLCAHDYEQSIFSLKAIIDRKHDYLVDRPCRLVELGPNNDLVTVHPTEFWNKIA